MEPISKSCPKAAGRKKRCKADKRTIKMAIPDVDLTGDFGYCAASMDTSTNCTQ